MIKKSFCLSRCAKPRATCKILVKQRTNRRLQRQTDSLERHSNQTQALRREDPHSTTNLMLAPQTWLKQAVLKSKGSIIWVVQSLRALDLVKTATEIYLTPGQLHKHKTEAYGTSIFSKALHWLKLSKGTQLMRINSKTRQRKWETAMTQCIESL